MFELPSLFGAFVKKKKKITKSVYELGHVCPSVCSHGTIRLPLDEFSYRLISGFDVCVTVHL